MLVFTIKFTLNFFLSPLSPALLSVRLSVVFLPCLAVFAHKSTPLQKNKAHRLVSIRSNAVLFIQL